MLGLVLHSQCKICNGNFCIYQSRILWSLCLKFYDLVFYLATKILISLVVVEYIGETGRTIAERTNLHRSQIKIEKYRKLIVSNHVSSCGNGNRFKIFPFHKCSKGDHIYREEVEGRFRAIVRPDLH